MDLYPPSVELRSKEELFQEFLSRIRLYLPEWNPGGERDAGEALARIFFEMYEQVRMRLNRMPEKSLIAFLDTLGIDLVPAQSARTWVAFTAVPGAPTNAIVRTGSELAGKGKDSSGKDQDAPFQTLQDVAVSPAMLKELVSVRAVTDEIYRYVFEEKKPVDATPFSGSDIQEHSLYIAHPDIFNLSQKADFVINFLLNSGVQRDLLQDNGEWFIWEYFNETTGDWIKLGSVKTDTTNKLTNSGKMELNKVYDGAIPQMTVNGIKSRWIRCRALQDLTAAVSKSLPEITTLKLGINNKNYPLDPEMAFNNNVPIDIGAKTVRFMGINAGNLWLRAGAKSGDDKNYAVISFPAGSVPTLIPDDRIQLEDGIEWSIDAIITDNGDEFRKLRVFNTDLIPEGLVPQYLRYVKKDPLSPEPNEKDIDIEWWCSNNLLATIAVIENTKGENLKGYELKYVIKENGNVIQAEIIKDITSTSIVCKVTNVEQKSKDILTYVSGSAVRLLTAIRKDENNPSISIALTDTTELPDSRYFYFKENGWENKPLIDNLQATITAFKARVESVDGTKGSASINLTTLTGTSFVNDRQRLEGDIAYLIPHIKPFGEVPFTGDMFYLACDEAFSKKDATIIIDLLFALNGPPSSTIGNRTYIYKISPILLWEYWNDKTKTWRRLNVLDTTRNFTNVTATSINVTQSDWNRGRLQFDCPDDIAKSKVNGEEKFWIRARILDGDYGKTIKMVEEIIKVYDENGDPVYEPAPPLKPPPPPLQKTVTVEVATTAIVNFPILKYISISYESEQVYPSTCFCLNTAEYVDVTDQIVAENEPFIPFKELPYKNDTIFFGFDRQLTGGPLRIYFHLKTEFPEQANAKSEWSYWNGTAWNKLTVDDTTEAFSQNGTVEFFGKRDFTQTTLFGESRYWLKVTVSGGTFPEGLAFDGIYFNTAEAIQSTLITNEQMGASDGTRNQIFRTVRSPIIEQDVWVREPSEPDETEMKKIVENEPDADTPVVKVTDNGPWQGEFWVLWHSVDDFDDTGEDDRHYRVDRRTGTIFFGDGEKGMIPPKGAANLKISYRYGGGVVGNVESGSITTIKSSIPYIKGVTNPFAAAGGAESETTETAVKRGSECLQHRNRAVTAEDFERVTLLSRAVARALCLPNIDEEGVSNTGWISMLIIPDTAQRPPVVSEQLIANVKTSLEAACVGTIGTDKRLTVRSPQFIKIRVEATIIPKTADSAAGIVNDSVTALDNFLDPIKGGLNSTGWEFGATVCKSAIIALLEGVENVSYTLECRIFADDVCYSDDVPIPYDAVTVSGLHSIDLESPDYALMQSKKLEKTGCECT